LRDEFQKANVELHFYKGGKSEDTPEGRMKDNIEAVFSDYWKAKIVEGSRLGRRRKAQNGKWVGDGWAPYGYTRVGKARDVHLEIDEDEAAVIQRMFKMYIGANGRPMTFQGIAAMLTAEAIPPPNRGVGGDKKPSQIWHMGTVRRLITKSTFIGDFEYGGIEFSLPELAIVDRETFEAAQKRRTTSRAQANIKRKYDFLLAGHVRCSCGIGMSASHYKKGRYRCYECNSVSNRRHARECEELKVRAPDAEEIAWEWVNTIICDEDQLQDGLSHLAELAIKDLDSKRERLTEVEDDMGQA
jgi:site-specific DNA recombinase